ncbi:MAG: Chaperone protein DnaK [Parabacteroides sp.]
MANEITNLYEELEEELNVSQTDVDIVLKAIDDKIIWYRKKINNPRYKAIVPIKTKALNNLKAQISDNPDVIKQHAAAYAEIARQKHLEQEKVVFDKNDVYKPRKVYGIDFGTTYSSIAFVDVFGKPVTVMNQFNSPVTPSVVYFESSNSVNVGVVAKEALGVEPELVCSDVKLQLGNEDYVFSAHGTDYRPETIIAFILSKLVKDANEILEEDVKDVVITYPVYFGIEEKVAMTNAAKIAGLNVVNTISEPIAAAYSYGLLDDDTPKTVLIYDLGGETFDVTIIKVDSGVIEVIATGGDHNLGGKDWDAEIQKYAIDQYVQQTGGSADDIYDDTVALGDLELKSEQAKKQLSQREKTSFRLNGAKIEISVDQFENITAHLLQSSIDKTRNAMNDAAAKGITHYDKILLVGGSTLMPQVKKRLEQEFPNAEFGFCDPYEVTARGAAIYGKQMLHSNNGEGDSIFSCIPVLNKGIALSTFHNIDNLILHNVFVKNTPLPCAKMIHTKTIRENQKTICLGLYDHDYTHTSTDMIAHMRFLVSKTIQLPKPLPINSPIDILVQVNENGLLADINIIDVLNDDVIIVKPELDSTH